jgi:GT2 family glycosyltransferase
MQLSVIIVSYNTAALTVQTVKSVYKSIAAKSSLARNFEVIVVDNDSHDQTLAKLKKLRLPRLKLIASHANLGFGRANNLGFKSATGQYILFLNSDTIVTSGALEQLVDYCQAHQRDRHPLGLLSAQLLNPDGTLQPQGGDLPNLFTIATTMFFLDDLPLLRRFIPAVQHTGRRFRASKVAAMPFIAQGWVAGTAVIVYRELLENYGGWDQNIFMYGEDQELSYRLRRAGYRHGILTAARITHFGSASSSSRNAILGEISGYLYFFRKYHPKQWPYLKLLLWLAMLCRTFIYGVIKNDSARVKIYAAALQLVEDAEF